MTTPPIWPEWRPIETFEPLGDDVLFFQPEEQCLMALGCCRVEVMREAEGVFAIVEQQP